MLCALPSASTNVTRGMSVSASRIAVSDTDQKICWPSRLARPDQVLGDLRLAVDPDRVAARLDEVDAAPLAGPLEVDAVVAHPLAVQALTDAVVGEDVDGAVLDDAGTDAREDVVLRTVLDDDRLDAVLREDLGEQQAGRTGTDDGDLGTHGGKPGPIRPSPPGETSAGRKRPFRCLIPTGQRDMRRVIEAAATRRAGANFTRSRRTVLVTSASEATTCSSGPSTGTASEQVP